MSTIVSWDRVHKFYNLNSISCKQFHLNVLKHIFPPPLGSCLTDLPSIWWTWGLNVQGSQWHVFGKFSIAHRGVPRVKSDGEVKSIFWGFEIHHFRFFWGRKFWLVLLWVVLFYQGVFGILKKLNGKICGKKFLGYIKWTLIFKKWT